MTIRCKKCGAVHEVDFEIKMCMNCGERLDGKKDTDEDIVEWLENLEKGKQIMEVA